MIVSQLLHVMDKDDTVIIDDGAARGIKRDDPVNRMHVHHVLADGDVIVILAEPSNMKGERE